MSSNSPICVVVLTGNEKQAKRLSSVQELVDAQSTRPVVVELIAPAWTRNCGRVFSEFRRAVVHADAVVLGTYVPTELGAAARSEVRRLHIPHVRTSKLGQHGLADAVLAAVELAEVA
jgi:hypothetical protein